MPLLRIRETPGTTFTDQSKNLSHEEFQNNAFQEVIRGNVPDFMRRDQFKEITLTGTVNGKVVTAKVRVSIDYLAVGQDKDMVRTPLDARWARYVTDRLGMVLPTKKIVDAIDEAAKEEGGYLHFYAAPQIAAHILDPNTNLPLSYTWDPNHPDGRWMRSPIFSAVGSTMNDQEIYDINPGNAIRSGHRKDVIYDPLALGESTEGGPPVVIYHNGIQPNSNFHGERYYDYSHGIRLVDATVTIITTDDQGKAHEERRQMAEVLRNDRGDDVYKLFSDVPMDITKMYKSNLGKAEAKVVQLPDATAIEQINRPLDIKNGEIEGITLTMPTSTPGSYLVVRLPDEVVDEMVNYYKSLLPSMRAGFLDDWISKNQEKALEEYLGGAGNSFSFDAVPARPNPYLSHATPRRASRPSETSDQYAAPGHKLIGQIHVWEPSDGPLEYWLGKIPPGWRAPADDNELPYEVRVRANFFQPKYEAGKIPLGDARIEEFNGRRYLYLACKHTIPQPIHDSVTVLVQSQ